MCRPKRKQALQIDDGVATSRLNGPLGRLAPAAARGPKHHIDCRCCCRPHPLLLQIAALAYKNKRFAAIDRAISRNGLKFVTLLRLSPLLPLAVSNYLYGLTSVDLGSYVLGSWLGMLPGGWARVGGWLHG